jgi:uncharacterized membrane protein
MTWLILGVMLFTGAHMATTAPALRGQLIKVVGKQPYRGLFSLEVLTGIVLMVVGWRSTVPEYLYAPPSWGAVVAIPLMYVALVLFLSSRLPTNLKRVVRHPQLAGVVTWAVAHLLANGDSRSLVLFGGIGLWAVIEMGLLNRRDGAWQRPDPLPLSADLKPLVGGAVVFVILFLAHPYIAGVTPLAR